MAAIRFRFKLDPLLMRHATYEQMQRLAEHDGWEVVTGPTSRVFNDPNPITKVTFHDGWTTEVYNREIDVISPHEGDDQSSVASQDSP